MKYSVWMILFSILGGMTVGTMGTMLLWQPHPQFTLMELNMGGMHQQRVIVRPEDELALEKAAMRYPVVKEIQTTQFNAWTNKTELSFGTDISVGLITTVGMVSR